MDEVSRPLRFVPPGHMVEITLRTIQGRLLMRPSRTATQTIAGCIGRAQRLYDVEIHAIVAMGNHMHLLISPRDCEQMARFMSHVGSNVARKIGRLVGWHERFWGRRYRAITVSNEEEAQIGRLRYLLAHGSKEGLVHSPIDWPGVHTARPLVDGSMTIEGIWYDGTAAYRGGASGKQRPANAYEEREVIHLSPIPCWSHLAPDSYRRRVTELVKSIEQETVERHRRTETAPTGAAFVLARDPHEKPRAIKRDPAPSFHVASKKALLLLRAAYASFVIAYRAATDRLRRGEWPVHFPRGCFPPALPFVPG